MRRYIQIFFLAAFSFLKAGAQNKVIDSLMHEVAGAKPDSVKAMLLGEIGHGYTNLGYFDSAGIYLGTALTLARKVQHKKIESIMLNLLGINEYYRGDNPKARRYWNACLSEARKRQDKKLEMDVLQNLANVETSEGQYPQALTISLECLKNAEAAKNTQMITQIKINIGIIYSLQADYDNALRYLLEAERYFPSGASSVDYLLCLTNIAQTYIDMNKIDVAEKYYTKALIIGRKVENVQTEITALAGMAIINKEKGKYLEAADQLSSAIQLAFKTGDDIGPAVNIQGLSNVYLEAVKNKNREFIDKMAGGSARIGLVKAKKYADSAIRVFRAAGDIENLKTTYADKSEIEKLLGDYPAALESYIFYSALKDSLFNMEKHKKLTQLAMQYEFDKKEAAVKAAQERKDVRSRLIRNSIAGGLAGSLIFLFVVYRQRNKIKAGKQRSDELLLNILPEEVAEELKEKGTAEAKQFDQVTVMFTDFKGFTQIAEKLTPAELVAEIDTCFKAFDRIVQRHGIEKIKTIGDAYMCAGGLPVVNATHAVDVAKAALEIKEFMNEHSKQRRDAGQDVFEIRIGIHTGPVVAGIVGVRKFAYDIWGDTVNTASRMESSGVPGEINISGSTYELVKDHFSCTHRGKIAAKNKGEIDMYFLAA